MSDLKTNEEIKKQELYALIKDKEYLKALEFFNANKNEVIFDKWDVHHLAREIHNLEYYQESYNLHEMIFINEPNQLEIDFYERINESWIKINDLDFYTYYKCFYCNNTDEIPEDTIKYCSKCGNKLTNILYGYINILRAALVKTTF